MAIPRIVHNEQRGPQPYARSATLRIMNGTTAMEPPYSSTLTNGITNGNGLIPHDDATTPTGVASHFDSSIFRSYLLALLPPVLGTSQEELEGIFDEEFEERVARFAAEGGAALYVVKQREEVEGVFLCSCSSMGVDGIHTSFTDDAVQRYTYHLTSHLIYTPANMTTLALIKRGPTLDPLLPLATQLHILNLFGGDETPYESLHAVVRDGVKPWFDAFVGARGGGKDGVSKMGT